MNEIAAILLFVATSESIPFQSAKTSPYREIFTLNSLEHIEADVYWMFDEVMKLGIKDLYDSEAEPSAIERLVSWNTDPRNDRSQDPNCSAVIRRCHRIYHRYLALLDNELYSHCEKNRVEPQMLFL